MKTIIVDLPEIKDVTFSKSKSMIKAEYNGFEAFLPDEKEYTSKDVYRVLIGMICQKEMKVKREHTEGLYIGRQDFDKDEIRGIGNVRFMSEYLIRQSTFFAIQPLSDDYFEVFYRPEMKAYVNNLFEVMQSVKC